MTIYNNYSDDVQTLEDIANTTPVSTTSILEETTRTQKSAYETNRKSYINEFVDNIIYTKASLGKNGKEIQAYKFRTMVKDADDYLLDMLNNENNLNHQGKLVDDSRITRTGKFLRKFWIDELPQLYNILRGNMKLVGIRPMQEEFWEKYPQDIKTNALKQKPGLLGVNYATSKKDGAEHFEVLRNYLNEYEKHPFLTDIKYFYKIWHNILIKGERSR